VWIVIWSLESLIVDRCCRRVVRVRVRVRPCRAWRVLPQSHEALSLVSCPLANGQRRMKVTPPTPTLHGTRFERLSCSVQAAPAALPLARTRRSSCRIGTWRLDSTLGYEAEAWFRVAARKYEQ